MEHPQGGQHGGPPAVGVQKKRQRVYQHWQGNERFFCWGYLVAGPNWKAGIGTALVIAVPAGVFLAFVAPYMGVHVHAIILVISCILPVLAVWFLMLTACRDPGIIPRQEPDQEYLSGTKPRTKEVFVNNQRVVIRYNDTCHFYQPPRAHHCSVNDNCIERFDHHCPWVGTTIGLRNYRSFLLFVYTTTVLCLYVFGVCIAMLFVKHNELVQDARDAGRATSSLWGKALGKCIPALVLMGYTFLFFWFVGGLSVFHAYLVATNQTTYENFRQIAFSLPVSILNRYNHDNRPNPYSRGCLGNCAEVWCTPIPPSKVQFRAYVDEAKPPTGQPYSPYLNGPGSQMQQEGAGQEQGGGNGGGGVFALEPASQPQAPIVVPPSHQQAGVSLGSIGGGYAYNQVASANGASYDPAGLGQSYGIPYGGHSQRYDIGAGQSNRHGDMHSVTYSDAGAGWASGNEQQVKSAGTFTSQTVPSTSGPGLSGSPRGYAGGGYTHMAMGGQGIAGRSGYAAVNSYQSGHGISSYYADQYDIEDDEYAEYAEGDEEEEAHVHSQSPAQDSAHQQQGPYATGFDERCEQCGIVST
ncbi:hypothetical protein VOLCADRAFT_106120 [Volvox carteri f. nagariensis]|uniref:S-acyltransferase n=1 Tax=Volvox carteri f. nagariensis TaxID=3068 RepID=D8U581_VOLCA|nr:uncharacterized protein VOLCADRAFT_106120 [Volvox carteri f. nagariensis]EFJ45166.1 hypothetical protein VOLCADRAFT_106120 [Volvox carteri f. nagariensis]|eukprot:XP_002953842.1 hypothetical protein VOLCADRAFT_106120 [Volvox carteri f. nagariensis]